VVADACCLSPQAVVLWLVLGSAKACWELLHHVMHSPLQGLARLAHLLLLLPFIARA
jgi:hypothetical protein